MVSLVQLIAGTICFVQHSEEIKQMEASFEEMQYAVLELIANELADYVVIMMAIGAVLTIPILAHMMKKDRILKETLGIVPNNKAPISKYWLVAGISIPFALGTNNIVLFSNLAAYSELYQETAEVFYANDFIVQIVCLGVISPIVEELIFRGLIYNRIKLGLKGSVPAMIISSFMFGFYHGNIVQTIYGCLSGLLLAYVYEKFGSIKAPILAHIVMNLVALILTEVNVFVWMFKDVTRMGVITVACAAIASSVFLLIKKIDEKPLKCEAE